MKLSKTEWCQNLSWGSKNKQNPLTKPEHTNIQRKVKHIMGWPQDLDSHFVTMFENVLFFPQHGRRKLFFKRSSRNFPQMLGA